MNPMGNIAVGAGSRAMVAELTRHRNVIEAYDQIFILFDRSSAFFVSAAVL